MVQRGYPSAMELYHQFFELINKKELFKAAKAEREEIIACFCEILEKMCAELMEQNGQSTFFDLVVGSLANHLRISPNNLGGFSSFSLHCDVQCCEAMPSYGAYLFLHSFWLFLRDENGLELQKEEIYQRVKKYFKKNLDVKKVPPEKLFELLTFIDGALMKKRSRASIPENPYVEKVVSRTEVQPVQRQQTKELVQEPQPQRESAAPVAQPQAQPAQAGKAKKEASPVKEAVPVKKAQQLETSLQEMQAQKARLAQEIHQQEQALQAVQAQKAELAQAVQQQKQALQAVQAQKAELAQAVQQQKQALQTAQAHAAQLAQDAQAKVDKMLEQAQQKVEIIYAKSAMDAAKKRQEGYRQIATEQQTTYGDTLATLRESLQKTNDQLSALAKNVQQNFVQMAANQWIELYNIIADVADSQSAACAEKSSAMQEINLDNLREFLYIISDNLVTYGIETIMSSPNAPFDGSIHDVGSMASFNPATATIAKSMRVGFQWGKKVLQKELVVLNEEW